MKNIFIFLTFTECCKLGWLEYGGLCILPVGFQNREIYPEKVSSWTDAQQFCEEKKSKLMSVTNAGLISNEKNKSHNIIRSKFFIICTDG